MGKEKIQIIETKEQERLFHYEILGIILLILVMLAIAKLGIVGTYLMLITKLLFGDWFFIIYGILLAYSIRCILVHKRLNIANIRYVGIFLLFLSALLLSHFNVHNFVSEYEGNKLYITMKLYFNYFKNNASEEITGGGVIGALLFYLFYYLFSSIGVICMSIIFVFLGIVFVCKKTIKEFVTMIINFFKKIINIFNKTSSSIRNKVDQVDLSYNKLKVKYKISKSNVDEYYKNEEIFARKNVEIIKKVLNSMNVFYNDISFIICRNITTFFVISHFQFSYEAFRRNLSNYFHSFQLKKDENTNELLIELNNINPIPLRIGDLPKDVRKEVIFGIDDRNEMLKLEESINKLLVFGENKKLVTDYLDSIVLALMHLKSEIEYSYIDFNLISRFATSKNVEELDHILIKINDRINLFNQNNCSTLVEYENKTSKRVKYQLIIINGLEKIIDDRRILDKIMYMLEVTLENGYYFIFTSNNSSKEFSNLYNSFNYRFYLDNNAFDNNFSELKFNYLNNNIEGYLQYKSIVIRACLLMATIDELNSIR